MSSRAPVHRYLGAFGFGSLLLALIAWSGCEGDLGSVFPPGSPCHTVYADQCGSPCNTDGECPVGLYCGGGICRADCTKDGGECGAGMECDADGRCVDGGSGGAGGGIFTTSTSTGTNSGGSGQGGSCGEVEVTFEPQTPTVVLLIDQSGSMTSDFNGQPRWDVVYDALMDPQDGVVMSLQDTVRFGLALYTYDGSGQTCPEIVDVMPPALNAHGAIDAVYSQQGPSGNTPTGDSLTQVAADLQTFQEEGPKLIVLATDGDPDRCEDPNAPRRRISMQEVIDAVDRCLRARTSRPSSSRWATRSATTISKTWPTPAPVCRHRPAIRAPIRWRVRPPTSRPPKQASDRRVYGHHQWAAHLRVHAQRPSHRRQGMRRRPCWSTGVKHPLQRSQRLAAQRRRARSSSWATTCDTIMNDPNVTVERLLPLRRHRSSARLMGGSIPNPRGRSSR